MIKTVREEVKTIQTMIYCEKCTTGEVYFNGHNKGETYEHECRSCGFKLHIDGKIYPRIEYVPIKRLDDEE